MAGNYPDAPSRRFAIDADGTILWYTETTGAYMYSPSTMSSLINDESQSYYSYDPSTGSHSSHYIGLLFPEPREFDGLFYAYSEDVNSTGRPSTVDTSLNTTNGVDGTWTNQISDYPNIQTVDVNFRTQIQSTAVSSMLGIRVKLERYLTYQLRTRALHLYGTISPGETPDRILFLDTANSDAEFSKVLDYGEVPRGQTQTRTIKIKNNSSTKTINTIQMTAEDLYLNAGGFYTFSLDDVSYQATLNTIGNLGPGATKPIYVKQSVPDAETLGLQTARLRVTHASLT